ncbi:MAG: hypothetical protein QXK06_01625 [Candidatus Diapherotrites archaeon]
MVLIEKTGVPAFMIPDEQAEALGFSKGKKYEVLKARDGIFVLVETTRQKSPAELDKAIFALLAEKKLSERVEGKFEEFLSSEERERLKELIKEGKIIPFRLSDQYRKAVYKTKEEVELARPEPFEAEKVKSAVGTAMPSKKAEPQKTETEAKESLKSQAMQAQTEKRIEKDWDSEEKIPIKPMILPSLKEKTRQEFPSTNAKTIQEPFNKPSSQASKLAVEPQEAKPAYSLERDNFTVISTEDEAKQLCEEKNEEIRRRELLGIKSFDGDYLVIKTEMYEKQAPEVLAFIKKKSIATADEISTALHLNKQLVKVICEFLKEEGEITEKRKELFEFVP